METLREPQFVLLPSSDNAVGWNAALLGNFEGAWKNVDEPRALGGLSKSCPSARSMLLDFAASGRDEQPIRKVPVWQLPDSQAFFFVSGMAIDELRMPTIPTTRGLMNWRMLARPPIGTESLPIDMAIR